MPRRRRKAGAGWIKRKKKRKPRDRPSRRRRLRSHAGWRADPKDVPVGIQFAQQALAASREMSRELIDFDDMIYLPVVTACRVWQNDWLLVDEAQDINPARRALARKMLRPNGRAIFVGDRHQAIYGFTGADADAVNRISKDFRCKLIPLTTTYRCPKAVVEAARSYVDHIEAHATAPEGLVRNMHEEEMVAADLTPQDAILCRLTKPLVQTAYKLIKAGIGCHVEGRDIGAGLLKLVDRWKRIKTLETLQKRLETYLETETERLVAKGQETKAEAVQDRVETLIVLMEGCQSIDQLRQKIEDLFSNSEDGHQNTLTLSTVHKSKGREWTRVFVLGFAKYMPSKFARQAWQTEQEHNLIYVAFTRAKAELILVDVEPRREAEAAPIAPALTELENNGLPPWPKMPEGWNEAAIIPRWTSELSVGAIVFVLTEARVYRRKWNGSRHVAVGGPVQRYRYEVRRISGETRVSWLLQHSEWDKDPARWEKVPKRDTSRLLGRDDVEDAIWIGEHQHKISRAVPGCIEFRAILDAMKGKLPGMPSRKFVLSAEQVASAREAAREAGHRPAALAYAIQFEGAIRQWDVKGQWLPLDDRAPSAVIYKGKKWIGPTWAHVDANLVLRWTPTKTEDTTAPDIVVDLAACPMVMEELQEVPQSARKGPLIANPETGRPYSEDRFSEVWRAAAEVAGISKQVWNRDLRKSRSTEARAAGAPIDDLKKLMGHSEETTVTAEVYDLANLEAHRRIAAARRAHREKKQ